MPADEVTVGELYRMMRSLESRMDAGFTKVGTSIESLSYVHADRYDADQRAMERRVSDLEDNKKWVGRALAGSMISAIGAAVVALLAAKGGL